MNPAVLPPPDCGICPRLAAFRLENRERLPGGHNAPVPSFGDAGAPLLIVGLAPGLRGANRTGRPFTGDGAGDFLFPMLLEVGLAAGDYAARPDDGLSLLRCRITNAVRCVPPVNRPTPAEVRGCNDFLRSEIASMPHLRAIIALGTVAHQAVLRAKALPLPAFPFAHGAQHRLPEGLVLADSYHCSRQNTNTGRLTPAMFRAVFESVLPLL